MRLWLALIVMLTATPLRADPICDMIEALGRIATVSRAGDLAALDQELRQTDLERAMSILRDHPLARHRADLDAALRLAGEAVALAHLSGEAAASARLAAPAAREVLGRLVQLLALHACAPDRAVGPRAVPKDEPASGLDAVAGRAELRMVDPAGLGLIALVLAGLGALAGVLARRKRRRHRQAQRYPVNLPTRLRAGTAETEARLVDISRLGAKLRIDPDFQPGPLGAVNIKLGHRRIGAQARWRNHHYVGVEFLRPLPEEEMEPFRTMPEPKPEDAAPQPD